MMVCTDLIPRSIYSDLNLSMPSPPLMTAFMNEKNLSAYSGGGTGLILCCAHKISPDTESNNHAKLTISSFNPFQICSIFFTVLYGVKISMTPK